jgi:Carboxypeptidase regulatory-like domain
MLFPLFRVSLAFLFLTSWLTLANGQTTHGTISGRVVDSSGAILPGAKVELQPGGATAITDTNGQFTISNLTAGDYTMTVNYVGFAVNSQKVTVTAGQVSRVSANMKVATANENIVVTSERGHGEGGQLLSSCRR